MTGEIEAAQRLFESLTRLAPNNLGYSNLYALALAADTDLQSRSLARRLALKNLRISPNQLNVLSVAGWLEYSQGSKLNGKKLMSRLEQQAEASGVSIDRDTAFFLAYFQSDQGRMNEAIKLLEDAIAAPGVFMHKRRAEELLQRLQALPVNSGPLR
jgi:tetratricopeptide (TPR) repeat protein